MVRWELDWTAMSQSARRRQAEDFSDRKMAAGAANVYREALSGRSRQ